jgi:hypothetical protein
MTTLLSSERARIVTKERCVAFKSSYVRGYILACGKRLRTCSPAGVTHQLITF